MNALWLPELGPSWVFLSHEWRFIDDAGIGRKSDVLAVELSTGRLGIVELKDADAKLHDARAQVDGYAEWWQRDAAELAPLFTEPRLVCSSGWRRRVGRYGSSRDDGPMEDFEGRTGASAGTNRQKESA
ncbi:MAG: hypothetical protein KF819_37975 [Labilithrix sp.]|nr:hypothetical protein [Labilithrix sp.]